MTIEDGSFPYTGDGGGGGDDDNDDGGEDGNGANGNNNNNNNNNGRRKRRVATDSGFKMKKVLAAEDLVSSLIIDFVKFT